MSKKRPTKKRPYAHHVPQKKRPMSRRMKALFMGIIASAALLGVLLAVVLFYTPQQNNDNADDALLDPALHVKTWDAILTQPEEAYLVYLYHDNCEACERLEPVIAEYAQGNEQNVVIYFARLDERAFSRTDPPAWSFDSTRVDRPITPSILTVENGEVVGSPVAFESNIINFLGRYEPPAND